MSLNDTPAVQIQTPPLTAQNFGNIGPSTSAIIVQQQVQPTTIPTQSGSFNAQVLPPQTTPRMPTFTMPVIHILPNLSAWTFPNPTVNTAPIVTTIPPPTQPTAPTVMPFPHMRTCAAPTVHVTAGGTVYYLPPATVTTPIVYSTVANRQLLSVQQPLHLCQPERQRLCNQVQPDSRYKILPCCYLQPRKTICRSGN